MYRPVIKENTARVVAAHQNNVLLLWRGISVKLNIGKKLKVRNNDIKSRRNLACFQTNRTDV